MDRTTMRPDAASSATTSIPRTTRRIRIRRTLVRQIGVCRVPNAQRRWDNLRKIFGLLRRDSPTRGCSELAPGSPHRVKIRRGATLWCAPPFSPHRGNGVCQTQRLQRSRNAFFRNCGAPYLPRCCQRFNTAWIICPIRSRSSKPQPPAASSGAHSNTASANHDCRPRPDAWPSAGSSWRSISSSTVPIP